MSQLDHTLVVRGLNFFTPPDGRWCGSVRGGNLGESMVLKGGSGVGW